MARINVSVPDEQKEWLDEHNEYSASGLLQSVIKEKMKSPKIQFHDSNENLQKLLIHSMPKNTAKCELCEAEVQTDEGQVAYAWWIKHALEKHSEQIPEL